MKIAILGDVHIGARGDLLAFHNLNKNFYQKIFFPYLLENNIDTVFQLGDLFDRRKYISFQSLSLARKYLFDKLVKHGIFMHVLLGNHDIAYKNTLEVNSPELLLEEYKGNIQIHNKPYTTESGIDIIPWICQENQKEIMQFINQSTSKYCFGHFELTGFEMDRGNICYDGMDPNLLNRYDLVLSGHFHHKSSIGNIVYVGTPTELTWSDYADERGFHIFDTETSELEFIRNPYTMFEKVFYNDEDLTLKQINQTDYSHLEAKYVKLVVEKRTDAHLLDTVIDKISEANPLDLTVVENFLEIVDTNNDFVDQAEDTLTILEKYVDGLTLQIEPSIIKKKLRDVYNEAMALETT